MFRLIIIMGCAFLLSACQTTVDDISVKTDDYSVRVKSNNNPDGYGFCPPGQAKNGNC